MEPCTPIDGITDDLFDRYLADEVTTEEGRLVAGYLAGHPEAERNLKQISSLHPNLNDGGTWPLSSLWADQVARIAQEAKVITPRAGDAERGASWRRRTFSSMSHLWVGTTICLGLIVGGLLFTTFVRQQPNPAKLSSDFTTYTTANGQRATITFADGSSALLNVGSTLQIPTHFSAGHRIVRLSGEALFQVTPREGQPFTVLAGASSTQVLGTSFLVRHYANDTVATIAVREGKVMVQSKALTAKVPASTVLTAAQQVTVGTSDVSEILPASPTMFSFASGVLMLEGMPFVTAIPQLNRWYDADIQLGDSVLATRKIVGGFRIGSLTDLVGLLEVTLDVSIVRTGRVLTLYQRRQ